MLRSPTWLTHTLHRWFASVVLKIIWCFYRRLCFLSLSRRPSSPRLRLFKGFCGFDMSFAYQLSPFVEASLAKTFASLSLVKIWLYLFGSNEKVVNIQADVDLAIYFDILPSTFLSTTPRLWIHLQQHQLPLELICLYHLVLIEISSIVPSYPDPYENRIIYQITPPSLNCLLLPLIVWFGLLFFQVFIFPLL